jgi:hypothetical protein
VPAAYIDAGSGAEDCRYHLKDEVRRRQQALQKVAVRFPAPQRTKQVLESTDVETISSLRIFQWLGGFFVGQAISKTGCLFFAHEIWKDGIRAAERIVYARYETVDGFFECHHLVVQGRLR